ncbi:MAG: hypothetical protein V8T00_01740 [Oscillospiraceae bacterium]
MHEEAIAGSDKRTTAYRRCCGCAGGIFLRGYHERVRRLEQEGRSRAETAGANAAGPAKAAGEKPESRKPETKVVRFPKGQPIRAEGEPKEPKNPADFKGQTIRFTPIREDTAPEEKPKIWTYQAEPDPEPVSDDPKEAKKAAQRARRAEKEAKKRQKQLERHQKQQAKRMERRKSSPSGNFPTAARLIPTTRRGRSSGCGCF